MVIIISYSKTISKLFIKLLLALRAKLYCIFAIISNKRNPKENTSEAGKTDNP
jgi:hypothetical protein